PRHHHLAAVTGMTLRLTAARIWLGGAFATALGAAAASVLSAPAAWSVTLLALVVLLGSLGYRSATAAGRAHAQQLTDLHLATIEALALAIDAKDQVSPNHIRRVQVYAAGLARALGMSE